MADKFDVSIWKGNIMHIICVAIIINLYHDCEKVKNGEKKQQEERPRGRRVRGGEQKQKLEVRGSEKSWKKNKNRAEESHNYTNR